MKNATSAVNPSYDSLEDRNGEGLHDPRYDASFAEAQAAAEREIVTSERRIKEVPPAEAGANQIRF